MEKAKISTKAMSIITFISVMVILLAASLAFGMTSSLGVASASNRGSVIGIGGETEKTAGGDSEKTGGDSEKTDADGAQIDGDENSATPQAETPLMFTSTYDKLKKEYTITGFDVSWLNDPLLCPDKEDIAIVIPATWDDGKNGEAPVTVLGYQAFFAGLTAVGGKYEGCKYTSLDMSSATNLRKFEYGVFMDSIYITGTLTIPESVVELAGCVFYRCKGFTGDLIIPNSWTTIPNSMFYGCNGFDGTLTIGNSVTTIGEMAFDGCSNFTGALIIPDSVTVIWNVAFRDCSKFTSLTLGSGLKGLYGPPFMGCSGFTGDLIIPEGVTSVGQSAFHSCSGFNGILTIPKSLKTIGNHAFWSLTKIKTAYINNDLSSYNNVNTPLTGIGGPIVVSKDSYAAFSKHGAFADVAGKITYEMNLKFDDNNVATAEQAELHLFNQKLGYKKDLETQIWAVDAGYTLPTITDKTGYTKGGWYRNYNSETGEFTTPLLYTTIMDTETCFAKQTAHTYTVTFGSDGGVGSIAPMTFAYDEVKNLTTNTFTKEGFFFNGWTFGGKKYADGASVKNLTAEDKATVNLVAVWSGKKPIVVIITAPGTAGKVAYDGSEKPITIGGANADAGNFITKYSVDGVNWVDKVPVQSGTYFFKVTRAEDSALGGFAEFEANGEFEILNATLVYDVPVGYEGEYDGAGHSITVTADATQNGQDVTIKYSFAELGEYTLTENPLARNVTINGSSTTLTVYFEISAPNHNTVRGSAAIKITPIEIRITADDKRIAKGMADVPLTGSVTSGELLGGDSITWALDRPTGTEAGSYNIVIGATVVVDSNDGKNYKLVYIGAAYTIAKVTVLSELDVENENAIAASIEDPTQGIDFGAKFVLQTIANGSNTQLIAPNGKHIVMTYNMALSKEGIVIPANGNFTIHFKLPSELVGKKGIKVIMVSSGAKTLSDGATANGVDVIDVTEDGYITFNTATLGDFAIVVDNDVADAETPSNVGLIVGLCVGLPIGIGVILSLLWFGLKKKSSKKATPSKKN